jgi:hypothetical protein
MRLQKSKFTASMEYYRQECNELRAIIVSPTADATLIRKRAHTSRPPRTHGNNQIQGASSPLTTSGTSATGRASASSFRDAISKPTLLPTRSTGKGEVTNMGAQGPLPTALQEQIDSLKDVVAKLSLVVEKQAKTLDEYRCSSGVALARHLFLGLSEDKQVSCLAYLLRAGVDIAEFGEQTSADHEPPMGDSPMNTSRTMTSFSACHVSPIGAINKELCEAGVVVVDAAAPMARDVDVEVVANISDVKIGITEDVQNQEEEDVPVSDIVPSIVIVDTESTCQGSPIILNTPGSDWVARVSKEEWFQVAPSTGFFRAADGTTQSMGMGLFALHSFTKGSHLIDFSAELICEAVFQSRLAAGPMRYCIKVSGDDYLDSQFTLRECMASRANSFRNGFTENNVPLTKANARLVVKGKRAWLVAETNIQASATSPVEIFYDYGNGHSLDSVRAVLPPVPSGSKVLTQDLRGPEILEPELMDALRNLHAEGGGLRIDIDIGDLPYVRASRFLEVVNAGGDCTLMFVQLFALSVTRSVNAHAVKLEGDLVPRAGFCFLEAMMQAHGYLPPRKREARAPVLRQFLALHKEQFVTNITSSNSLSSEEKRDYVQLVQEWEDLLEQGVEHIPFESYGRDLMTTHFPGKYALWASIPGTNTETFLAQSDSSCCHHHSWWDIIASTQKHQTRLHGTHFFGTQVKLRTGLLRKLLQSLVEQAKAIVIRSLYCNEGGPQK